MSLNLPLPKHPSRRDLNIYEAHAGQGIKQTVLAQTHKLTRGRISQIITRVKRWITSAKPIGDMDIPQQVLLATDAWQRKLGFMEELALNQFIEQCPNHPAPLAPLRGEGLGVRGEGCGTRDNNKKPTKPDPRLLQRAADLGRETYELAQIHADAQMAVLNFLAKDPRWAEDRRVEYTFQLIAEAQQRAKLYPDIPLPEFNAQEIERYTRNAFRYNQLNRAERDRLFYLPPAWKQAVGQMFYWCDEEFVAEMKRQEAEEALAKELRYEAEAQTQLEQSAARQARYTAKREAERAAKEAEAKQHAEEEKQRREEEKNNPAPPPAPPPPAPTFQFPTYKNMDFTRRPEQRPPQRNNVIRGIHPITWE